MSRWLLLALLLVSFSACSKPVDLPDVVVTAPAPGDFTRLRADLGTRFPADQLKTFDTAVQELRLSGMSRNLATSEARELDMVATVNGKTVRAIEILGWQARCARFKGEIAQLDELKQADLKQPQTPGIVARIGRAQGVIDKLSADLAKAETELVAMQAAAQSKS